MGRKGGLARTPAKIAAVRRNGKLGGRPTGNSKQRRKARRAVKP
jgi:hypothetical protein